MDRKRWILPILAGLLVVATVWFGRRSTPEFPVDSDGYRIVDSPCGLRFPEDHGSHPDHKTEWWYYTGNLRDKNGADYGFQLTFFRSRIAPPSAEADWPEPRSAWRTSQLFLAHAAVSDIDGGRFYQTDRVARGALDIAGAVREGETVRVHLRDWRAEIDGDRHRLRAEGPELDIDLTLRTEKPPVPHGEDGYSRKGGKPESASCYYSLTRLAAEGTVRAGAGGKPASATGLAWMDHEFSSAPLESGLEGWDWFSLRLSDGTELMVYLLRRENGERSPASSATWVGRDGIGRHVEADGIAVEVTDTWESPHTGATYPAGWRLRIPGRGVDLRVSPRLADQEMRTERSTGVTYWEGAVSVEGTGAEGEPVRGSGYVELTGYAEAFDAPM